MEILRNWYTSFAVYDSANSSLMQIAEFLWKKGLITDTASRLKYLGKVYKISNLPLAVAKGKAYSFDDFSAIFVKSVFKESLIQVIHDIETESKNIQKKGEEGKEGGANLTLKISNF